MKPQIMGTTKGKREEEGSVMMANRTVILADGENLFLRYQEMVKKGRKPRPDVIHHKDGLVWHPRITDIALLEIIRVSYYTTKVGSEDNLYKFRRYIAGVPFTYESLAGEQGDGTLCPHVYKKENRNTKTKSVDINITIDALRHTYNNSTDIIYLLAGDGDYIPLINEIMRQGKQVFLGAFSSGLNPDLTHTVDDFFSLDEIFFLSPENGQQAPTAVVDGTTDTT